MYPAFRVKFRHKEPGKDSEIIERVCYTLKDIVAFLKMYKKELVKNNTRFYRANGSAETIHKMFQFQGKEIDHELFFKLNTPVYLIDGSEIIINPNLRELNFHKFKDPFTTYQDISMFMGGVLSNTGPKTINIKDKDMLFKKGFDNTSFKTISPGKKFNRRNKNG